MSALVDQRQAALEDLWTLMGDCWVEHLDETEIEILSAALARVAARQLRRRQPASRRLTLV